MIDFKLPSLGENITSGDVINVLVHEGQVIAANDGVIELETDKAVIEIPCPHAGKVAKVLVKKGQTVKVGDMLLSVEAATSAAPMPAAEKAAQAPPPVVQATGAAGTPKGDSPIFVERKLGQSPGEPLPAGPAVRRAARELGVDLAQIAGSGKHGRITLEDVQAAAAGPAGVAQPGTSGGLSQFSTGGLSRFSSDENGTVPLTAAAAPAVPPGEPGTDAWGPVRRERMSKIRRTIAAQMVKSATTIPHVTNFDDADVTELEQLRKGVPPGYLGANVKLTLMPFVLKAVAAALRRHPVVNASLDDDGEQIVYKQYVNLGIAVDTPRGLVVPVLRNVDRLSVPQIARELAALAEKARNAQFAVEDLRGGTFTISNLGAVGGTYSTPIINHPEAAVLLLGRARWLPAVREGKIEPRLLLPLSLSYDHRLIDGAAAGRFLNDVIESLENPARLVVGG